VHSCLIYIDDKFYRNTIEFNEVGNPVRHEHSL
jgi:hypothetical protein